MPAVDTKLLLTVIDQLEELPYRFVFLGGAITGLLVDHPELIEFRPTQDVDVLVQVLSRTEFHQLEQAARDHGFKHDISEGAPICRWILNDSVKLDIMPLDQKILGFGSPWFQAAWEHAEPLEFQARIIHTITPVYFIATKLTAFQSRGKEDFWASHDLEDTVTVIDGREEIVNEVKNAEASVRTFITEQFRSYLKQQDFNDALIGHLPSDPASQERLPRLRKQIQGIADL